MMIELDTPVRSFRTEGVSGYDFSSTFVDIPRVGAKKMVFIGNAHPPDMASFNILGRPRIHVTELS